MANMVKQSNWRSNFKRLIGFLLTVWLLFTSVITFRYFNSLAAIDLENHSAGDVKSFEKNSFSDTSNSIPQIPGADSLALNIPQKIDKSNNNKKQNIDNTNIIINNQNRNEKNENLIDNNIGITDKQQQIQEKKQQESLSHLQPQPQSQPQILVAAPAPPVAMTAGVTEAIRKEPTNSNTISIKNNCISPLMPTKDFNTCDINYKLNTTYLPNKTVLKPYLQSNAQSYFESIQFPSNCDDYEYHLISLPHFGVGSSIKHASKMFGAHWSKKIGVIHSNAQWRYGDGLCHDKSLGWSCFLSPLTNCTLHGNITAWVYNRKDLFVPLKDACSINEKKGYYNMSNGQCVCIDGYKRYEGICVEITDENKDIAPTLYDVAGERTLNGHLCKVWDRRPNELEKQHGELWYSAQILWFLFKNAPKRYILENYAKTVLGDNNANNANNANNNNNNKMKSCIAVHVRQGDSCGDVILGFKRKCFNFENYIENIIKMKNIYNNIEYNTVYMATDSNDIETKIKEWNNSINKTKYFEIIEQSTMDRNKYNTGLNFEDLTQSIAIGLSGISIVQELMQDIWAMSYCDMFIGDFTSSIARIAYEIMTIRKKYYPPFIVLSAPWCDNTQHFEYQGEKYIC